MIGRMIAFVLCLFALILPHRLRCWLSEGVGWFLQGVYYVYYGLLNFILNELRDAQATREKLAPPEGGSALPLERPAESKE